MSLESLGTLGRSLRFLPDTMTSGCAAVMPAGGAQGGGDAQLLAFPELVFAEAEGAFGDLHEGDLLLAQQVSQDCLVPGVGLEAAVLDRLDVDLLELPVRPPLQPLLHVGDCLAQQLVAVVLDPAD